MQLSELKKGQKAKIKEISGPVKRRLMEMGLIKGTQIQVICLAPLGDPVEIEVRDYKLTLRKKEADKIVVTEVQ